MCRLIKFSRDERPEGSQPPDGEGSFWRRLSIRSITDRRWLFPSSSTRRPMGRPCGLPTSGPEDRRRVYHVPSRYPCGLGRASPPAARRLRRESSEFPNLAAYLLVCTFRENLTDRAPMERVEMGIACHGSRRTGAFRQPPQADAGTARGNPSWSADRPKRSRFLPARPLVATPCVCRHAKVAAARCPTG